jgi:hypothetical protein
MSSKLFGNFRLMGTPLCTDVNLTKVSFSKVVPKFPLPQLISKAFVPHEAPHTHPWGKFGHCVSVGHAIKMALQNSTNMTISIHS